MDDEKRTEIERWIIKAENDFNTAQLIVSSVNPITDTLCFHSHQTVEKILKAYLAFRDQAVEKTHDLGRIIGLCAKLDNSFLDIAPLLAEMTNYAAADRYPDSWREILLPEAKEAFEKAGKVMEFVKGKIVL